MSGINTVRGEVALGTFVFRPGYTALVAAENEIGSLFALLERTSDNSVTLTDMMALLWHCLRDAPAVLTREGFADTLCTHGLAKITPVYRQVIEAALVGM
jgi:Phage tail tube protein, GTA-gp10